MKKTLLILVVFGLFSIGYVLYYQQQMIDFDKIVAQSELKEKKFNKVPREYVTKKGIKFWLIEDNQVELISLSFSFNKAGTAYDDEDKQGLSKIVGQMLDGGTKKYDYNAYHNFLDLNGVAIGFGTDNDYFNGYMTTPSYNKKQAFDMLKQVLFEPRLETDLLETVKKQFAVLVKTQKETPKAELALKFRQEIFGNHPYARTIETMAESVAKITVNDIKNFLQNDLVKENLIISVAGDISSEEVSEFIDMTFAEFKENNSKSELAVPELNLAPKIIDIKRQTAQVISSFALKGVKRNDAEFYPLFIANHIFGGAGLTSRLSLETREKEGLTYGVYTYLITDDMSPLIVGGFSAVPDNYNKMKHLIHNQMREFAVNGATNEELKATKDYLLASYNLRFKSTLELSGMLNQMQKSKLGLDFLQKRNEYVKNVTLEDVNKVATKYFSSMPKEVRIGLIK